MLKLPAAARPPDAKFTMKNLPNSVFGLYFGNIFLIESLNARLNACVGKYRMQFVKFPRQNAAKPCSALMREKQLPMPV